MLDLHAQAILDLLTAAFPPPRKVFDGKVDPPVSNVKATPYVLARFSEVEPALNFVGSTHEYGIRVTLHCVGANDQAARRVARDAAAALQDVTPTVANRKCYPIRWDDSAEQPPEESLGVTVASQVLAYVLRSIPAP